jgi:hypothetical protein
LEYIILQLMPERATLANTARRGFVLNQSLETLAAVLTTPDGRQAGFGTQRASLGSVRFSHAMEGIMAGQVAARKKARKEAAKPKVEDWITKARWETLREADEGKPKADKQTSQWKDGSKFIRLNKPNGTLIRLVCVSWRH